MKEMFMQYYKENSNILCAMIDLSKPFDEINHVGMIDIIICKASLPHIIVIMYGSLSYYYYLLLLIYFIIRL